jgi:hypothetical protein
MAQTVPGGVPEGVFPVMVDEIQRRLDMVGHTSIMGGALTWSPATQTEETRRLVVRVCPEEGQTEVRIQEDLELLGGQKFAPAIGGFFGVMFGAALAASLGLGEPGGPLVTIMFGVIGVLTALFSVISFSANEREPELEALTLTLAELGRAASEE